MTKAELIKRVAEQNDTSVRVAKEFTESVFEGILNGMKEDGKVLIVGFGTFEMKDSKERIGRNPTTQEEITIPAQKRPKFKASKVMKELLA